MAIEPRTYKFAGIESDPHGKRWTPEARKKGVFRVVDFDMAAWHGEDWMVSRSMGKTRHEVSLHNREGIGSWGSGRRTWYDIRTVPEYARARLAIFDALISQLQRERKDYLVEHFREWPVASKEDCPKAFPGKSKADAEEECRRLNKTSKPSAAEIKSEINTAKNLNDIVFGRR